MRSNFENSRVAKWDDDGYLRPMKFVMPDIFVTRPLLTPALALANRLFAELEARGHRVVIAPARAGYEQKPYDHRDETKHEHATRIIDPYEWRRTWLPKRPTITFVGDVAIGLTLFEMSENVEVLHRNGAYIRMPASMAAARRAPVLSAHEWISRRDVASGRLALRAYSPYASATWAKVWRESRAGELARMRGSICDDVEGAADLVMKLVQEGEREAEEARKRWEIQRQVWLREEEERRQLEDEARREKQVREDIERWRLARDIREYVGQIGQLLQENGMRASADGDLERYLRSASAIADRSDPLRDLRDELARAVRQKAEQSIVGRIAGDGENGAEDDGGSSA
jgi:hypothetical protein